MLNCCVAQWMGFYAGWLNFFFASYFGFCRAWKALAVGFDRFIFNAIHNSGYQRVSNKKHVEYIAIGIYARAAVVAIQSIVEYSFHSFARHCWLATK